MKKYIYIEDQQMYFEKIVRFESEKEIPEKVLEECSLGNGRISQTFLEFKQKLEKSGYNINPIHINHFELFDGFIVCPVVYGGTGNY